MLQPVEVSDIPCKRSNISYKDEIEQFLASEYDACEITRENKTSHQLRNSLTQLIYKSEYRNAAVAVRGGRIFLVKRDKVNEIPNDRPTAKLIPVNINDIKSLSNHKIEKRDNHSRTNIASDTLKKFVDMGYEAVEVEVPDGYKNSSFVATLVSIIRRKNYDILALTRKGKVFLIKQDALKKI